MTEPIALSREERALFNPAFMALVTCRAVQGHQRDEGSCPLPIAVTAAVMALQPAIRELLPATTRASLPKWVQDNQTVRVLMAANAPGLAAMVRSGILLSLQTDLLALDETARLHLRRRAIPAAITGTSDTVVAIQRTAYMLGRWLPTGGSTATTLTLLGVRP
ncbi:three component ABC system middle component [Streptomyces griseus]|uniref:three component ABC system middle component n=1 Tax=Streptomyces griseus TaxID=1911 RepID=UPI0004C70400|nr:three component ABC system middle component [Streptomyces griseus]